MFLSIVLIAKPVVPCIIVDEQSVYFGFYFIIIFKEFAYLT